MSHPERERKTRQMLELLSTQATTVNDVIQVQRELTRKTQEYESYMQRAIGLKTNPEMS